MTERRELPSYGTTKVVDGVTFTASEFLIDGKVTPHWINWNGGARGGVIRERAAKTVTGTCGITHETREIALSRFEWGQVRRNTFHSIARMSIEAQRHQYREAKALVDAYERKA